jgi:three-Cys-motif partner protein
MSCSYEDREQTAVKHRVLARYLQALIPIVGDWSLDIIYVDCMAGPWHSEDPMLSDTSFAHAVSVMKSTKEILAQRGKHPTMRCLLIEKDSDAYERLRAYSEKSGGSIEVTTKNWDFTYHVQEIVNFARTRPKSFPFVFLDPTGWEQIQIPLIKPLLRLNPGEVLVNLMTSWIRRFLADESKHFDRLLGEEVPRLLKLRGDEQEQELVRSYGTSLKHAGDYDYVCTLPVMKPDQDAFHYHLLYGTRNRRGVEVFKETEAKVIPFMHQIRAEAQKRRKYLATGQTSMFSPSMHYKEKKFSAYRLRALLAAKAEIRAMLQNRRSVLYDDLWTAAMQYSTVLEADLRDWFDEWSKDNLIEITNMSARQRFPHAGRNQSVIWR